MARENAALLGLQGRADFVHASWAEGQPDGAFDIVVSNPPYIPSGDIAGLEPEVSRHEPRLALDGGADGLDAYRLLAGEILRVLKPGGLFALESGHDQGHAVEALMQEAKAGFCRVISDLGQRDRVVIGRSRPGTRNLTVRFSTKPLDLPDLRSLDPMMSSPKSSV